MMRGFHSQSAVDPLTSVIHKVNSFAGRPSNLLCASDKVPGLHLPTQQQASDLKGDLESRRPAQNKTH